MSDVITLTKDMKKAKLEISPNFKLIPTNLIPIKDDGMLRFNEIYDALKDSTYNKIVRTPSGGISIDRRNYRPPMWDCVHSRRGAELTILDASGMCRIQFTYAMNSNIKKADGSVEKFISGPKAMQIFRSKLLKMSGVDLYDYLIDNGLQVRDEVPEYINKFNERFVREADTIELATVYANAHHIDFHSSFPAGLANTHPEFRETIKYFYDRRKERPEFKNVLNCLIGQMWSKKWRNAGLANLSKDAIEDNNRRLMEITERLMESGRIPIMWNVDGVWYLGDVYHGIGEGDDLGQWHNDHVNCLIRFKSVGSYEFIEDGVYNIKVKGLAMDKRQGMKWGDIFTNVPNKYKFSEEEGILKCSKEEIEAVSLLG